MKDLINLKSLLIFNMFTLIGVFSNAQTISIENVNVNYPKRSLLPISVSTSDTHNYIEGTDLLEGTTWKYDYQNAIKKQFSEIGKHLFENPSSSVDTKIGYFLYGVAYGLTESNGIKTIGSDVTTTIKIKWVFGQNQDTLLVIEDVIGSGTTNIGNMFGGKANAKKRMELAINNVFLASYDTLYNNLNKLVGFISKNPNVINSDIAFNAALNRFNDVYYFNKDLIREQKVSDEELLKYNKQFPNSPFSQKIVTKLEQNHSKDPNYAELLSKLRVFKILEPQSPSFVVNKLLYYESLQREYLKQKINTYQIGVTKEDVFLEGGWNCVSSLSDTYGIVGFSNVDTVVTYDIGIIIFDKGLYAKNTNYSQFLKEFEDYYKEIIASKNKSKLIFKVKNLITKNDNKFMKDLYKVDNRWRSAGKTGGKEIKEVTISGSGFEVDVRYSLIFKEGVLSSIEKY